MSDSITRTNIVRYLDQEGCLLSFTGKLFYRTRVAPEMHDASREGWLRVQLAPVARFGAYQPDPQTLKVYEEEYGKVGADPVFGAALYPWYNVLVDTGIIAVRGVVHFRQITRYCPATPDLGCEAWIRDAPHTAAAGPIKSGR